MWFYRMWCSHVICLCDLPYVIFTCGIHMLIFFPSVCDIHMWFTHVKNASLSHVVFTCDSHMWHCGNVYKQYSHVMFTCDKLACDVRMWFSYVMFTCDVRLFNMWCWLIHMWCSHVIYLHVMFTCDYFCKSHVMFKKKHHMWCYSKITYGFPIRCHT